MSDLSKDEVKYIANLARIALNDEEVETLQKNMSSILDYVNKLNEIDISGIEPLASVNYVQASFREDEANPDTMRSVHPDPDVLFNMAPSKERNYVKVRQILSKE